MRTTTLSSASQKVGRDIKYSMKLNGFSITSNANNKCVSCVPTLSAKMARRLAIYMFQNTNYEKKLSTNATTLSLAYYTNASAILKRLHDSAGETFSLPLRSLQLPVKASHPARVVERARAQVGGFGLLARKYCSCLTSRFRHLLPGFHSRKSELIVLFPRGEGK